MKHEQVRTLLKDYVEAELPAHTIDLARAVRDSYQHARSKQRLVQRRRKLAAGFAAALLIICGLLFAVPSTLAEDAWEILLQRLGLDLGDEEEMRDATVGMLAPTYAPVTPTLVSQDALQAQVPFDLPEPGWLPDGLVYETGSIHRRDDGSIQVNRWYRPASSPGGPQTPHLRLEVANGDLGPVFLSEQAAQSVQVNGLPAVYIHGSWTTEEPIEPGETAHGLFWDYAEDSAYLSWADAELSYRLQANGLGLVLDNLIRIAESTNQ